MQHPVRTSKQIVDGLVCNQLVSGGLLIRNYLDDLLQNVKPFLGEDTNLTANSHQNELLVLD